MCQGEMQIENSTMCIDWFWVLDETSTMLGNEQTAIKGELFGER